MHRISCRLTAEIGLSAVLAAGLLTACGNSGSSASSTVLPQSAIAGGQLPGGNSADSGLVQTPPDVAPLPPGAGGQALPAGPPPTPLGPKETGYLNSLRQAGISPGDNQAEISVARMICWSIGHNQPSDQLRVFVNAVAGSDAKEAGKPVNDSDVGQLGQVYIDTAKAKYCR